MLHLVTTGAYYPPVVTKWKIFTTGASYLTTGTLCSGTHAYTYCWIKALAHDECGRDDMDGSYPLDFYNC